MTTVQQRIQQHLDRYCPSTFTVDSKQYDTGSYTPTELTIVKTKRRVFTGRSQVFVHPTMVLKSLLQLDYSIESSTTEEKITACLRQNGSRSTWLLVSGFELEVLGLDSLKLNDRFVIKQGRSGAWSLFQPLNPLAGIKTFDSFRDLAFALREQPKEFARPNPMAGLRA